MKTMQLKIVKRFMNQQDFDAFMDQYNENKYISRTVRKPSEKDLKIAKAFHGSKSASEVAKKFGLLSSYNVISAVGRVYAYKN